MTHVLEDIYFGDFQPSFHNYDNEEYRKADKCTKEREPLLNKLLREKNFNFFSIM